MIFTDEERELAERIGGIEGVRQVCRNRMELYLYGQVYYVPTLLKPTAPVTAAKPEKKGFEFL